MAKARFTCYAPIPDSAKSSPSARLDAARAVALDQAGHVRAGDEHEVVALGQALAERPERLAERALDRVSLRCAADLAADRDAEADVGLAVGGLIVLLPRERVEHQEPVRVRATVPIDPVEVTTAREPATLARVPHQGERRLRPLRLRRLITSRPARVRIRPRNPWVFARLRFFGCQVRFMIRGPGAGDSRRLNNGAARLRPADSASLSPPRATASIETRDRPTGAPRAAFRESAANPAELFAAICGVARRALRGPPLWSAAVAPRPIEDDPAAIWRRVRSELEASLPAATFDLWVEPLRAIGSSGETLYVTGPPRVRTWVERRYLDQLEGSLRRLDSGLERIVLVDPERGATPAGRAVAQPVPIDPAHTFDRFVIGPGSRFAHAAALAVAELPGEAYNPLFLHGPPGLGKTHLLGAIAGYYRDHHPELTVHSTTAERFTSEFVAALRTEGPERFKERYRGLDALLIDDVQVLEGKPRTEEEFVHTFNALFAAGKQIVLTSDRPPGSLERLEQRLRDRFEWGLAVEVEAPDLRTRIALLWRFAGDAVEQLPEPDVLRTIATRVPGNVRRLEGALTRVLAVSSVFDEPLAGSALARALPSPAGEPGSSGAADAPTVASIQQAVSARARRPPRGAPVQAAHPARHPRAAARDVPRPRPHVALARPDRPRVRPRPLDRPARAQGDRAAQRAGLRARG